MESFGKRFSILKLFSRIATKLLLADSQYFKKKMLLAHVVYGDEGRLHLGKGVNLQNAILNTNSGEIKIGDRAFFGHGCMVLTGRHDINLIGDDRINNHPTSGFDIDIGTGVWISSGAIILGGVKIADHAIIAAGAVVNRDCQERAIYAGVPARKIRNI